MSELKWDLDELVRKIMADLRNSSVETSAAKASAALTRDFNSLYSQRPLAPVHVDAGGGGDAEFGGGGGIDGREEVARAPRRYRYAGGAR